MFEKIFAEVNKMNIILPVLTLFEKIVAFIKQVIIADFFGTNQLTDEYQIAENVISLFRGAFSNSLPIVFLTHVVFKKARNDNWEEYCSKVFGTSSIVVLLVMIIFVTVICTLCISENGHVIGTLFSKTLLLFLLILSPTIFLGYISTLMGAMLEADKIYWPAKILSLLTSISIIVTVILLFEDYGLIAIFFGEIFALSAHVLLLLYVLKRNSLLITPKISFYEADQTRVWRSCIPLMISSSVYSLNSLIDKAIAVRVIDGAATVLQYSRALTLELFPTIIVTAFSGVIIRNLSERVAKKEFAELERWCTEILQLFFGFLGVVLIVSLIYSKELISIAFMRGAFDYNSVSLTNVAFYGYAFGIILLPIREISTRVFYAFNDTKIPFISSMIGIAVNVVLSIVLSQFVGLFGISFSTTISIAISGIINIIMLNRKYTITIMKISREWFKVFMGLLAVLILNIIISRFITSFNVVAFLTSVSLLSVMTYYIITKCLNSVSSVYIFSLYKRNE